MPTTDEYFRKYLKVAPFSLAIWRTQEAIALNKSDLKRPILDIGCGFGEFAGVFFNRAVEMGLDISKSDLNIALGKEGYEKLILADGRDLPFEDDIFNTVFSISTLEHIMDVYDVIQEVYRVLKKNGIFILTVPTLQLNDMLTVPYLLRKLGFTYFANAYITLFHKAFKHLLILPKRKWLDMLEDAGFLLVDCQGTISRKQIAWFEYGLPIALLTQISRRLFDRRLLVSPNARVEVLANVFKGLMNNSNLSEANIIITARKE